VAGSYDHERREAQRKVGGFLLFVVCFVFGFPAFALHDGAPLVAFAALIVVAGALSILFTAIGLRVLAKYIVAPAFILAVLGWCIYVVMETQRVHGSFWGLNFG